MSHHAQRIGYDAVVLFLDKPQRARLKTALYLEESGAGEGIRTLDPNLGKVVLYP